MSNCLRPTGAGPFFDSLHSHSCETPSRVPDTGRDPVPSSPGQWIHTSKGFRRVHPDEFAKGLGVPKQWMPSPLNLPSRSVKHLTGVHLWEGVSSCLDSLWPLVGLSSADRPPAPVSVPPASFSATDASAPVFESSEGTWEWTAPNLSQSGAWHRARLRGLKKAASRFPESERPSIISEGKADLARHRMNCGPDGPQHLQILWWEFPREHWSSLRHGNSMNFLRDPRLGLAPNSKLTDEQQIVAGEFADELVALHALELAPADDPALANCPLFVVPKPGQPGQWRIIADCKKGGQNESMGPDPVYLTQAPVVLQQMCSGGWTAVVDASKFFHQFKTVVSERKCMGLVHPVAGLHHRCVGLPMGTSSSPGIACKFGSSFLRRLCERHPALFSGQPLENTWRRHAAENTCDSRLGHGRVVVSDDGLPAVLTWGFVDDFALHGPTHAKTSAALSAFFSCAVEVGLLCNPAKIDPPAQITKCCGFLFDTRGVPALRVPPAKRSRARAMVEFVLQSRGAPISRLSLVVVTGVLESQVPAAPSRLGHTYLRRVCDALWDLSQDDEPSLTAEDRCHQMVTLTSGAWADLDWWHNCLQSDDGRPACPRLTSTLVAHFGDGSGAGTGGTSQVVGDDPTLPLQPLEMWMGRWDHHIHHFSSNWRELKTLELTLRREVARKDRRSRDTTLFCFADNLVTHHITNGGAARNPDLQATICNIKALEQQLGCILEVVHIPGASIIAQGSDDLSRGVWMSPHRSHESAPVLIPNLFTGVHLGAHWLEHLRLHIPGFPSSDTTVRTWDDALAGPSFFDQCALWAPPVEMAPGLLSQLVALWTERPHTTSAVVLLPRMPQRHWQRLSRFLVPLRPATDANSVHKRDCFSFHDQSSPVCHRLPVVVLHLAPHTPTLPSDRMEPTPSSLPWQRRQWFEHQKELLCRLSTPDSTSG